MIVPQRHTMVTRGHTVPRSGVGRRIKERRDVLGLTQEDLALRIEASRSTLANYELGRREPDLVTLQKLAHALNTSISYLVGETDDPFPPPSIAAAHRQGAEPGSPLDPEAQLIIERAVRRAIEELDERERRRQQQSKESKPDK